jgi:peptidoglycan/LPS O-acetylase OafA/YrhL
MMGHGGLRGLMALHVCVFHYLFGLSRWSPLHLNTQGNAHMPFFFLLSGFSLAAIYGADVMGQQQQQQHTSTSTSTSTSTNKRNSDYSSGNGGTTTTIASATSTSTPSTTSTKAKATSLASFYRNRAARVLPLFYLAHLCAAPLTLVGFGVPPKHFRESALRNLFATSTWVSD